MDETLVFSTKKRAPYYVCLEMFRPEEFISCSFPRVIFRNNRDYDYEKTVMESKLLKSVKDSIFATFSNKSSSAKSSMKYRDLDMKLSEKKTMKVFDFLGL